MANLYKIKNKEKENWNLIQLINNIKEILKTIRWMDMDNLNILMEINIWDILNKIKSMVEENIKLLKWIKYIKVNGIMI
jgi:hypothetical protein